MWDVPHKARQGDIDFKFYYDEWFSPIDFSTPLEVTKLRVTNLKRLIIARSN